ncbi:hypothetical protein BC829DRAFT_157659 [Chytridium lagenaria]|nr:hypothetical protein BC829DRAFT_157659 [Chytridium lagenaria]
MPTMTDALDNRYAPYLSPWPVKDPSHKRRRPHYPHNNLSPSRHNHPHRTSHRLLTPQNTLSRITASSVSPRLPATPVPTTSTLFGCNPDPVHHGPTRVVSASSKRFYCSSECMENDRVRHERECRVVKELPGIAAMHGVDYTLLRLVLAVVGRRCQESMNEKNEGEGGAVPVAFFRGFGNT